MPFLLKVLLGRKLRNFLLILAICLSSLNIMNWLLYNYLEMVNTLEEARRIINMSRVMYINTTQGYTQKTVRRYPELDLSGPKGSDKDGILFERWPPLDTTNVRNRHLQFNPKQHPLEVDLVKLTRAIIDGKKIKNEQINPHNFKYLHEGSNICKTKELFLILVVKSKVDNFASRQAIRKTWGNISIYQGVRIVFILGHKKELDEKVKSEANEFKDIVQENFVDEYSNNTLKTVMGFNWVSKFCSNAKFNLYVDDDVFVVVKNLDNYRRHDDKEQKIMAGKLLGHSVPFRDNGSKWFISWEEFPFDRYPPYLAGGGVIVSWDVTRSFSAAFPYVKPIRIDDAYLGVVAKKLDITVRNHGGMVIRNPGKIQKTAMPMNFQQVVAFHRIPSTESMIETWKAYCRTTNICTV